MWKIYYKDKVVDGKTEEDWLRAPDDDVQAVVIMEPYPNVLDSNGNEVPFRPWVGVEDRQIQTGIDYYSINGWKEKIGSWMNDDEYHSLMEEVFYG